MKLAFLAKSTSVHGVLKGPFKENEEHLAISRTPLPKSANKLPTLALEMNMCPPKILKKEYLVCDSPS